MCERNRRMALVQQIKIRKFLKLLYPRLMIDRLKLCLQNFERHAPILIYQMGKVGSTAVVHSLKRAHINREVYHVHFLSSMGIQEAERYHRQVGKLQTPYHIRFSKILSRKIAKSKSKVQWKIITLVRDPIAWEVSNFFQNMENYYPELINAQGQLDCEASLSLLRKKIADYDGATSYIATWFDKELKSVFGVDVYAHTFDMDKGFVAIQEGNISVLVMRLEDLDRNFSLAIASFLALDTPIPMVRSNIASDKKYADEYSYVLENLRIPEDVCTNIYASRYANHFYSQHMKQAFIQRWSGVGQ